MTADPVSAYAMAFEQLELAMARVDRLQTALGALLTCIDARQWASPQLQQAIDAAMAALEE